MLGDDGIEKAYEGGMNYVLLHGGENMEPNEFKAPKAPDDWFGPSPNTAKGGGGLDLKKWTTQSDGLAYPTALYLNLYHKGANTRLVVSQLAANQFPQIKATMQYVHMESGNLLPMVEEGERQGCV